METTTQEHKGIFNSINNVYEYKQITQEEFDNFFDDLEKQYQERFKESRTVKFQLGGKIYIFDADWFYSKKKVFNSEEDRQLYNQFLIDIGIRK